MKKILLSLGLVVLLSPVLVVLFTVPSFAQTWTATVLKEGTYSDSTFQVVVALTDGSTVVNKEYFIQPSADPLSDLIARVQNDISLQSNVKTKAASIPLGPLNLPAIKAATVDPAKDAYFASLRLLQQYYNLSLLGVIKTTDKAYTDALADTISKLNLTYYTAP